MKKLAFKVVSILVSVLGGMIAGRIFKQLWKLAAHEDEAPRATDVRRGNREVLVAAALQGAIFALVQAALDRGLAEATRKLTGSWPGEGAEQDQSEYTSAPRVAAVDQQLRILASVVGRDSHMGIILLVLLLALILGGLGFVLHVLWWIALVVLVLWLLGFLVRVGEGTSRGRWYRW